MRKISNWTAFFVFVLSFAMLNCGGNANKTEIAHQLYLHYINRLLSSAENLCQIITTNDAAAIQEGFKKARIFYKKIEGITEYYNPTTAKSINGPAIPEAEVYDDKVLPPQGFQVIEELIFPYDPANKEELMQQANALVVNIKHLKYTAQHNTFSDAHLWDAFRLHLFRLAAMGIAGFDSPVAQLSIEETAFALQGLKEFVEIYRTDQPSFTQLLAKLDAAIEFLRHNPDFNSFDRLHFIKNHLNRIGQDMRAAQLALQIPLFEHEKRVFHAAATHLFDYEYLNADYFKPVESLPATPEMIALGEALFYDPMLSGNNTRSCASCHQPDKAFTDGISKSVALEGKGFVSRNAPTLWNTAFQAMQFWEGRTVFLEDQIRDVLAAPNEMHSSIALVAQKINRSSVYKEKFQQVFGLDTQKTISEQQILNVIAAYLRSLVAMNTRFDKHMRESGEWLTAEEIKGFNLFMGKAKCGSCHFLPFFNGLTPPHFLHMESEVIGVPVSPDTANATIDPDLGKYELYRFDIFKHSFKTTTVRNAALTPPYMHNGVYKDLNQVIDFYNRGGGIGIGIDLENQTLPADPLQLTWEEQKALVAFIHSLTDTLPSHHVGAKLIRR